MEKIYKCPNCGKEDPMLYVVHRVLFEEWYMDYNLVDDQLELDNEHKSEGEKFDESMDEIECKYCHVFLNKDQVKEIMNNVDW